MSNPKLKAALAYAERGLNVFPLKPRTKLPATPNGLTDATTDPQRLKNWFNFNPEYNLGIRTDNLTVVDIDEFTPEAAEFISQLPPTLEVSTGKGVHLYFKGEGRNTSKRIKGLDTRGVGGYVVAPPSIHENGTPYEVVSDVPIAELPESVHSLMFKSPKSAARAEGPSEATPSSSAEVMEGGRNQYIASAAGTMQRRNILTLEALLSLNEERCSPPLPDSEVEAIYNSVSRYAPAKPIEVEGQSPWVVRAGDLSGLTIDGLADKAKVKGQSTGIPALDELLGGGYRLGEFTALSASAKTGKSSFVAQLIKHLLDQGIPVAYGSREMNPEAEVNPNILSMEFKENAWLSEMTDERRAKYEEAIKRWPLYFSPGYGYFPVSQIREWVTALVSIGVHYFFLDHLHYCLDDPEDYKAAVKLAQELKTITKEFNIALFCIIQPGKLMEGQKLGFNHMRGGAGVAQALDSVLILDRHRVDGREVRGVSALTLDIARHKLARPGKIFLEYDFGTTEFHHIEPTRAEDPQPATYGGSGSSARREL